MKVKRIANIRLIWFIHRKSCLWKKQKVDLRLSVAGILPILRRCHSELFFE